MIALDFPDRRTTRVRRSSDAAHGTHTLAGISLPLQRQFGETTRPDRWWIQPLLVFLGLSAFLVYSTWAALQGANYHYGPYLSPFYSPELWGNSPHAWFGKLPSWLPGWISPAILILWAPGGFRV